jgi:anaerobic magnesium-protoporphyrin IX monomethyl ester cyclase
VAMKPHLYSLEGAVRDLAQVRIVELDRAESPASLEHLLDQLDPHLDAEVGLVGVSCWTSLHYLGSVEVSRRVRRRLPDVPLVVGGHHPTAAPEDFLDGELADWIVRGDGEHVLRALCERWPPRPVRPQVVAGLPFDMSDPSHLDWSSYGVLDGKPQSVFWVSLSRGCPFRCGFCIEPERGARWSAYTPADALDVLERIAANQRPRVVCFGDALFGANQKWTTALLDGIAARRFPMKFWAETRPDRMTPELLEGFVKCGFKVDFGLDSGSATMIGHMGKSMDPRRYLERSRDTLSRSSALALHHDVYLMFNHPGETPDTTRETMEYVESLPGSGPTAGWVSSQRFFILPGTEVYARMHEFRSRGARFRHPRWWKERADHHSLATDVVPSAAWGGRERDLDAFLGWQEGLNLDWWNRYPDRVHEFRNDFFGA